jgi:hypothetical protein
VDILLINSGRSGLLGRNASFLRYMKTTAPKGYEMAVSATQAVKVRYCLYARKSTESEERQVLSIDSQIKEMLALAEKENLEIVTMKRESHSAKETGQRPIFNDSPILRVRSSCL